MVQFRRLVLACVVGTTLAVPASADARPSASPAARLAGAVVAAKGPAGRQRALLDVLRAVGVGVYTGQGKALVRGAERRQDDLWLYDFELRSLARQLAERRRVTPRELAERIGRLGWREAGGGPPQAPAVRTALAGLARRRLPWSAARNRAAAVLVELGRRGGHPITAAAPTYDALQAWLVEADLRATAAGARRGRQTAPATSASPCFSGAKRVTKAVKGLGALTDAVDGVLEKVSGFLVAPIHGGYLFRSIEFAQTVSSAASLKQTHLGPPPHDLLAGSELSFQVVARMLEDPPEAAVRCGPLAGLQFPKKGPIPGVTVEWDGIVAGGLEVLEKYGTIVRKDEETGPDGTATLVMRPDSEPVPDVGQRFEVTGVLQPEASWASVFGNTVANIPEAIGLKDTTIAFGVSGHRARGYRFRAELPEESRCPSGECGSTSTQQYTYDAKVCGPELYGRPWNGTETTVIRGAGTGGTRTVVQDLTFVLAAPMQPATWNPPGYEGDPDNRVDFSFFPDQDRMHVVARHSNAFDRGDPEYRAFQTEGDGRVVEAEDCPPLPEP